MTTMTASGMPTSGLADSRRGWLVISAVWLRRIGVDLAWAAVLCAIPALAATFFVPADGAARTFVALWLLQLFLAAVVRVVGALALGSRPALRSGATRSAVTLAHWGAVLTVVLLCWAVMVAVGAGMPPDAGLTVGYQPSEALRGLVGLVVLLATLMVSVALVLRWGWVRGGLLLALWWAVLPWAFYALQVPVWVRALLEPGISYDVSGTPDVGDAPWWTWCAKMVLLATLHGLLLRRMAVD